jgi:hypothetical protein
MQREQESRTDLVRPALLSWCFQRCWRYDWVLDIDLKAYFDSIDWERLLKAIRHRKPEKVERLVRKVATAVRILAVDDLQIPSKLVAKL